MGTQAYTEQQRRNKQSQHNYNMMHDNYGNRSTALPRFFLCSSGVVAAYKYRNQIHNVYCN